MKAFLLLAMTLFSCSIHAQSGRKAPKTISPPPPPVEETKPAATTKPADEPLPVTAEKNEEYRCTNDGTLARVIDKPSEDESIFTSKTVDVRAVVTDKPRPSYTREANRAGVQGYVILRVLLTSGGEIGRIRVVRKLSYGLTENAIRVACKIKFKPAMKDGKQVSQWLDVEYAFKLGDASIYRR